MNKELIIKINDKEAFISILENGRLSEIHRQKNNQNFSVGDIYIGKVKKIVDSLNAAFVDIGYLKDAFLHYHDLGSHFISFLNLIYDNKIINKKKKFNISEIEKGGKINNLLKKGQKILVQITKEPISNKGPRLTTKISLAGRYLILIPFENKILISHKIKNKKERNRLISIVENLKRKKFGIIIRTVAVNKKKELLLSDLYYLNNKWKNILKKIKKKNAPSKIMREMDKTSLVLRDIFNDDFISLVCDDEDICDEMNVYLKTISPDKKNIVKYYSNKEISILEKFGIEKQMKIFLGKNVPLSMGAYLVIEHTEALHVIDVNSGVGNYIKNKQENIALEVNILAASEIAKQLRLRDIGGIIVIDFIDMHNILHKKKLYDHLKNEMRNDRAKYKILPPSRFGLIQITRQRVRPELNIKTYEDNPNKFNNKIESPESHIARIESCIEIFIREGNKNIILYIHPFINAYLKIGIFSIQNKWFLKYKRWIKIIPISSFKYLEYKIVNSFNKTLLYHSN